LISYIRFTYTASPVSNRVIMEGHFMSVVRINDDTSLEYECFGATGDECVLLISGAGAPMQYWPEAFCQRLADLSFFVIRYCHRDTGFSTHFDDPYSIDELLSDMTALLAELGVKQAVHLVGHSMGGYLAQLAICTLPGRFKSAASISGGPTVTTEIAAELGITGSKEEVWEILMANLPTGNFENDLNGWMKSWRFLNGSCPFDEEMAVAYTKSLYVGDDRNWQVAENHIHAMSTVPKNLANNLKSADCPLLVVHGTEDPLVPVDNGMASARLAKSGAIHVLEGAGHMMFDEGTWEEIADAILAHIRD
jgi:pimeloyl-ACP methyl ester carboxylesterase